MQVVTLYAGTRDIVPAAADVLTMYADGICSVCQRATQAVVRVDSDTVAVGIHDRRCSECLPLVADIDLRCHEYTLIAGVVGEFIHRQ